MCAYLQFIYLSTYITPSYMIKKRIGIFISAFKHNEDMFITTLSTLITPSPPEIILGFFCVCDNYWLLCSQIVWIEWCILHCDLSSYKKMPGYPLLCIEMHMRIYDVFPIAEEWPKKSTMSYLVLCPNDHQKVMPWLTILFAYLL